MAKQINVLYGFNSDKIQQAIAKEITLRGFIPKGVKMTTKDLIADYLKNHPEVNVLILKEYLDGGGIYSPIELTKLVDEVRHVNVVIVIATNHRGKNEMRELYSAGILNAFFSDGKFGANPDKLAELATKGRTRKEARQYYRIDEVIPDYVNITYEEFRENYRYLVDDRRGLNIIDRFVQISRMLYPGQMGAFIDRLPDKVKQILMKYKEFYDIANRVYKLGYAKEKYKVPKGVVEGITKEAIKEKLIEDSKAEDIPFEPEIVAAKSSSTPVKEVAYDEPIGLDRVAEKEQDMPSVKEVKEESGSDVESEEKPKKKGLFGRRKEKKQKPKDDGRGESIFDQESDVEFETDGVPISPVGNSDNWGDVVTPEEGVEVEVKAPMEQGEILAVHPVGAEIPSKGVAEDVPMDTPAAQESDLLMADDDSNIISETEEGTGGVTASDDLDSLSVEELKKLLGS